MVTIFDLNEPPLDETPIDLNEPPLDNDPIDLNEPPLDDDPIDLNEPPLDDDPIDLNDPPTSMNNPIRNEEGERHTVEEETWEGLARQQMGQVNDHGRKKRRHLTNAERAAIYLALLERSHNGKMKKRTTREVQTMFNVNLQTIQRLWKRHKDNPQGTLADVTCRRTQNCGRKRIEIDLRKVKETDLNKRTTFAAVGEILGVSTAKSFSLFKQGVIRRHSSTMKPYLREHHKISRMQFCLSMLDENTLSNEPTFKGMYNYVHIDEKWFYLSRNKETYYLLADEEDPDRTCQNKNNVSKVMFLCATARPRFDREGRVVFSGKLGIWPFVTEQPAQRSSRNRPAGTIEMKAITSVTRSIIKEYLIEKVIPAIKEKWPRSDCTETIFIQQDNARTHVPSTDPDIIAAGTRDGYDIRLTCQPAKSPDLNILDLGFFRAIQSLQHKLRTKNIPELVDAVQNAFDDYSPIKLSYVWLTLQLCMKEIMKSGGGNKYRIPHINKTRLQRLGCIPARIQCEGSLLQATRNLLLEQQGSGSSGANFEEAGDIHDE